MSDVEIERRAHPRARLGFIDDMVVERGTKADWELLEHLHYKAEGLPAAPRFWRLALDGDTVGVIVTASPKPLLKERHVLFPKLKPDGAETKITNVHRFKLLNDHFRVIARMVVDTLYRGTGASYRFQNLASRMEGARFVEIQSSMSKFNPFALKAGFRFAPVANSNKFDQGLKFFRQTFAAAPADHEAIVAEIEAMSPRLRERTLEDVRTFYYRHSALEKTGSNRGKGRGRVDEMTPAELVKNLQQMVLASPAYGVFQNPDAGRALPAQLPLRAFATQGLATHSQMRGCAPVTLPARLPGRPRGYCDERRRSTDREADRDHRPGDEGQRRRRFSRHGRTPGPADLRVLQAGGAVLSPDPGDARRPGAEGESEAPRPEPGHHRADAEGIRADAGSPRGKSHQLQ